MLQYNEISKNCSKKSGEVKLVAWHHWCSCGESKNQPFCDGSHQSPELTPLPFEIKKQKDVFYANITNR